MSHYKNHIRQQLYMRSHIFVGMLKVGWVQYPLLSLMLLGNPGLILWQMQRYLWFNYSYLSYGTLLLVKTNSIHLNKRKVAIFGWITDCLSLNCLPLNLRFGITLDANSALYIHYALIIISFLYMNMALYIHVSICYALEINLNFLCCFWKALMMMVIIELNYLRYTDSSITVM